MTLRLRSNNRVLFKNISNFVNRSQPETVTKMRSLISWKKNSLTVRGSINEFYRIAFSFKNSGNMLLFWCSSICNLIFKLSFLRKKQSASWWNVFFERELVRYSAGCTRLLNKKAFIGYLKLCKKGL